MSLNLALDLTMRIKSDSTKFRNFQTRMKHSSTISTCLGHFSARSKMSFKTIFMARQEYVPQYCPMTIILEISYANLHGNGSLLPRGQFPEEKGPSNIQSCSTKPAPFISADRFNGFGRDAYALLVRVFLQTKP